MTGQLSGIKLGQELKVCIDTFIALMGEEEVIDAVGTLIVDALKSGHKVISCGNGGSACIAEHLAEELTGRFRLDRVPLPAISLTLSSALITCIANDYSFEDVFSRQIQALAQSGDVLVVFSTSGNSPNIIRAIEVAKEKGVTTVGLLGRDGGLAVDIVDCAVVVKSDNTARIQEVHTFLIHYFCEMVEIVFNPNYRR